MDLYLLLSIGIFSTLLISWVALKIQNRLILTSSATMNYLLGVLIILGLISMTAHIGVAIPTISGETIAIFSKTIDVLHDIIKIIVGAIVGIITESSGILASSPVSPPKKEEKEPDVTEENLL